MIKFKKRKAPNKIMTTAAGITVAVAARIRATRCMSPNFQPRFAQYIHSWRDAESRDCAGSHAAVVAFRRAFGVADGDIAVEVGGGEEKFGRSAVGQVGDGGRDNVAAPAILDGHGDAERGAQVAGLPRLGQPAKLADLDVDDIHGLIGMPAQKHVERIDVLVEDEWMIAMAADRQAFL